MQVIRSEFLGLENISYRQRLRVLLVKRFETLISSISLRKEKIECNFININDDLNLKKRKSLVLLSALNVF